MANKKTPKELDEEVRQLDERISKLRVKKQQLMQQKAQQENAAILSLVKENKLSIDTLKTLISANANSDNDVDKGEKNYVKTEEE